MKIIPAQQLRDALHAKFPNAQIVLLDAEYHVLTLEALRELQSDWEQYMRLRGFAGYVAEKGDCDDFAWLKRAWLIERNRIQGRATRAIASPYLHYRTREAVWHAINADVTPATGMAADLMVIPNEPQPGGGQFNSTQEEDASCNLILA